MAEIIRQSAFTGEHRMLKGGLHNHTTRSDGKSTPEEIIALFTSKGYDFMSLTDHRIYNRENFLPGSKLTIIPGMEFDAGFDNHDNNGFRCFHSVILGYDNDENGLEHNYTCESGDVNNQSDFQKYLDFFYSKNQLAFYCHPEWSSTPASYFDKLQGIFAMEVWNTGSVIACDMDKDAPYWDEILGLGNKWWGVATDDGHSPDQHCGGWVMVNAENNVSSILDALKEGSFYSTTGPVINDFYIEDGHAHLECEDCDMIIFRADKHPSKVTKCKEGESLTHASFDTKGGWNYVRAVVVGKDGKRAWTNPIFLK